MQPIINMRATANGGGDGFDGDGFDERLVAMFVEELTRPGDVVLDPFAGHGTTLVVAERLARRAVGVELSPTRFDLIRPRVSSAARLVNGDSRALFAGDDDRLDDLRDVDLCLTSPPYMTRWDHPENPLTAYTTLDSDYERYLDELTEVFRGVATHHLCEQGHLVVNVANIRFGPGVTTLAWDVGRRLADEHELDFVQDVLVCWDPPPQVITNDYWLVYRRR